MTTTVGIDVGGTTMKGVRWARSEVEGRAWRPTPRGVVEMLDAVVALATDLGAGLPLGLGMAGLVDHRRGVLVSAPHLPGENLAVAEVVGEKLAVRVVMDNDANLAALAEHAVGGRGGTTLMVVVGTGIGMGIVTDGAIVHGQAHAGEVGHITVDPGGRPCDCGRVGCWETKVSGRRLDSEAADALGPGASAADLVAEARQGNAEARDRVGRAAAWLANGVEALVLALDPHEVVIGGGVAEAGDLLLEPIRRRLAVTVGAGLRRATPVRTGILGPYAGAIGAARAAAGTIEGNT